MVEVNSVHGRATVMFVDYGTLDMVKFENIRLDIKFEEIPLFALRCTLHNIRVPGSGNQFEGAKVQWPIETLDLVYKMIVEHEFWVTIKDNGPPLQVLLYSKSLGSVTKKLVKQDLAEFVESHKKQKKSQSLE